MRLCRQFSLTVSVDKLWRIIRLMTLRLVSAIFFVLATSNAGAATAPRCGVNVHVPAQRVFAKVDDSEAWREYRSIEDVSALDPNGGISAQAVLATWRVTHLLASEDGPADCIVRLRALLGQSIVGKLMDCFNCLSLWTGALAALFVSRRILAGFPSSAVFPWWLP
jgi:hypothetical protein